MLRTSRACDGRRFTAFTPALLAVVLLLFAPWLARPVHTVGCRMAGMALASGATKAAPEAPRDTACMAACSLCAQLSPARLDTAEIAPARSLTAVRYARLETRASHTEPERATPPPR